MGAELTAVHWIYLVFILLIITFMVKRKDTSLICILGIFAVSLAATGNIVSSISGVFTGFIYAVTELSSTILIISIIAALSGVLAKTGINETMIAPFSRFMRTPGLSFWTIGIMMMLVSWFFWPSPAVALLGAVLLPAAIRSGLPAIGVAVAMNLFGHGIALSGDFVIQGAPKLTADAASLPVSDVIHASIPLVAIMGTVTALTAFLLLKRDMKKGELTAFEPRISSNENKKEEYLPRRIRIFFAFLIPALFLLDIAGMGVFHLQGGDAAALVGGTAIFILLILSLVSHRKNGLEQVTSYLTEGLQFGFKIFGPVIPIAAFFYLGDAGFSKIIGDYLPAASQGLVNDLGSSLASVVPLTREAAAVSMTVIGSITGLDGSGFSGISLAGSTAKLFGIAIGGGTAVLTALGQLAAIWVGGGTLIPWALIPAAAVCNVDPFELARRNLLPVSIGLIVTTIAAMFFI